MNLKTLLRAGGATALIGAMALTALPLSAQEENGRGRRHADSAEQAQERQQARAERQAQRAEAVSQRREQRQSQAPVAQVQSQPAREWSRGDRRSDTGAERAGRGWNRRDNASNDWGQARAAQAQAEAQARYQARAQAGSHAAARGDSQHWDGRGHDGGVQARAGAGNWQRNRSYSDRNRDGSYRHGYRDAVRGNRPGDGHHAGETGYAVRDGGDAYRHGYRDASRGYRPNDGHHQWDRRWRSDDRYNWYSYRNQYRDRYRLGRYYSPYGNYRYSRLSIGFRLGSLFYGSRYWINDPWQYRLPAAYGPYRWVRYYDDALLVDIYTGEVVDVIYDFFW